MFGSFSQCLDCLWERLDYSAEALLVLKTSVLSQFWGNSVGGLIWVKYIQHAAMEKMDEDLRTLPTLNTSTGDGDDSESLQFSIQPSRLILDPCVFLIQIQEDQNETLSRERMQQIINTPEPEIVRETQ